MKIHKQKDFVEAVQYLYSEWQADGTARKPKHFGSVGLGCWFPWFSEYPSWLFLRGILVPNEIDGYPLVLPESNPKKPKYIGVYDDFHGDYVKCRPLDYILIDGFGRIKVMCRRDFKKTYGFLFEQENSDV